MIAAKKNRALLLGSMLFYLSGFGQGADAQSWYAKLTEKHTGKTYACEQKITHGFSDGSLETMKGEFIMKGDNGFCAFIGQKEMVLTKKYFVSLDHEAKTMLVSENEHEESLRKRMEGLMTNWFNMLAKIASEDPDAVKVEEIGNDQIQISVNIPRKAALPYKKSVIKFNKNTMEMINNKLWLSSTTDPISLSLNKEQLTMETSYKYIASKNSQVNCDLAAYVIIDSKNLSIQPKYQAYRVYNLTNRTYVDTKK